MKKELSSTATYIVKLINTIGKAGINEVYNINLDNINYNNKNYHIIFKKDDSVAGEYNYYKYTLLIKCDDNRELKIETIPQEEVYGLNSYYNTKIVVSYKMLNNTDFKINSYTYNWNHNDLIKFNESDYFNKTYYEKETTVLEIISQAMNYMDSFYNSNELMVLSEVFDKKVDDSIEKNSESIKEAENLLSTLSEEQIHILKKVLSTHKK